MRLQVILKSVGKASDERWWSVRTILVSWGKTCDKHTGVAAHHCVTQNGFHCSYRKCSDISFSSLQKMEGALYDYKQEHRIWSSTSSIRKSCLGLLAPFACWKWQAGVSTWAVASWHQHHPALFLKPYFCCNWWHRYPPCCCLVTLIDVINQIPSFAIRW